MKVRLPVRKAILLRRTYEAPAEGRAGKIRLDFNENTSGCSAAARKALARLTAKQIATYPEYELSTKKLARYFRVNPGELLLTNGGDDALRVFFDTFVEPGTDVLICEPTFPMYRYYAEIAGARVKVLRYGAEHGVSLGGGARRPAKETAVIFPCESQQPDWHVGAARPIRKLLRAATETVVVLDEAYAEFSPASAVPWVPAISASFCGAHVFEGGRDGGASPGCRDRPARFPRVCTPGHAAISGEPCGPGSRGGGS